MKQLSSRDVAHVLQHCTQVYKANSGVDEPSLLADDFRFEFPVISLAKKVTTVLMLLIPPAHV